MNVAATVKQGATPERVQKSESTAQVATSAQTASSPTPPTDAGPAAKVAISNKARAALRAAGATPGDISKVNLNDKNAVARAVQKARLSHSTSVANANNTTTQTKMRALTVELGNKRATVDTEVGPDQDGDADDKDNTPANPSR
jgi:hypothetical protein